MRQGYLAALGYRASKSMVWLHENSVQRSIDAPPLDEQLVQDFRAVVWQAVEPRVTLSLFTPLADQQPLTFQPAQQRIQRAFVDVKPVLGENLAERIAVVLCSKGRERRHA